MCQSSLNDYAFEDSIEGHNTYHPSDTVTTVHKPWQLKRSVNYPDYWLFQGDVNIFNPSTIENILGDVGDVKFYPINQHYYTCTLETGDEGWDKTRKVGKDNRKYIK